VNECECLAGCAFFNDKMDSIPAMADIYKQKYCLGDSSACARHRVFASLGREYVPGDMYPNDAPYADKVIS